MSGIARVDVEGDQESLRSWLGGEELSIRITGEGARVVSVALATPDGELEIS